MQMSGYQPQNRLHHYKNYCKYSLLYEAVTGRTKGLNEVTKILKSFKSLKSLILSLHAAGKQRKDIASHVGCSKASISHVNNAVALKGRAACGKQKKTTPQDDRQTALSDCQYHWATKLSQKVELCKKFLLQVGGLGLGLGLGQAQVKAASVGKHAQRRIKTGHLNNAPKVIFSNQFTFCNEFGDREASVLEN